MKVKVRRPYLGDEGKTKTGQVLNITEGRFRELTTGKHARNPLVDPVDVGYKMEAAHQNKMEAAPQNKSRVVNLAGEAAGKASADPTSSRPGGGRTGARSAAALSRPARRQTPKKSKKRTAKRA